MKVPIIMLSGKAGCGKDAVASMLIKHWNAVVIAQADPMKRLAMKLFGFSEETLWGPSQRRDDVAPACKWDPSFYPGWLDAVLPDTSNGNAGEQLFAWFKYIERDWVPQHGNPRLVTARRVLQSLGTEWGRAFSKNMWVDLALRNARMLLENGSYSRTQGYSDDRSGSYNLVVITDGRFRNEILAVRAAGGVTVRVVSPKSGASGSASQHSSETEQDSIPDSWFDFILHNDKRHGLEALSQLVSEMMDELIPCPEYFSYEG